MFLILLRNMRINNDFEMNDIFLMLDVKLKIGDISIGFEILLNGLLNFYVW